MEKVQTLNLNHSDRRNSFCLLVPQNLTSESFSLAWHSHLVDAIVVLLVVQIQFKNFPI